MYKKNLDTIVFYWCEKCQIKGGTAGRWNKHHPTKAHSIADDRHRSNNEHKRKGNNRSDQSYTKTLETRIRALEAKK